ncbi:MAG: response regulator, partial [Elusimicrobia bacterium]|nr:response regulator [Elusimicrobiota bacterium]
GSLRGGERILVVDDDPAVAMIARRVLERHGYSVLVAHRGEEALALCADPARRVDLLLCDVVMAQMGGPELARRLAGVYPSCRTLFVSGYAVEGLARAEISQDRFLAKPFTAESLSRKVRQVLDAPAA